MTVSFSQQLKRYRKHAGFTLDELARRVGSTKSHLSQLERTPHIRPSADTVHQLSEVLRVPFGVLLGLQDKDHVSIRDLPSSDQEFFRSYQALPANTRQSIRRIMAVV